MALAARKTLASKRPTVSRKRPTRKVTVEKKAPEIDPVLKYALESRSELKKAGQTPTGIDRFGGLVRYIFVHSEGKKSSCFSGGCFLSFPENFRAAGKGSKYLMTQTNPNRYIHGEEGMPLVHKYVDYLLNRSVFAEVFAHKDAEDSWENGYVLDMSFPAQKVISAAIYARYAREQWRWIADFNSCIEAGIPEDEAFAAMMFYRKSAVGDSIVPTLQFGGHCVLMQGCFTKKGLKNLLNKEYSDTATINTSPCSESGHYSGISKIFCDPGSGISHPDYSRIATKSLDTKDVSGGFLRSNVYSVKNLKTMWDMFKDLNLPVESKASS